MSPKFSKIWYVSFDKQHPLDEVWLYREKCGTYEEACKYETRLIDRGYRTKKWWVVEDNPTVAAPVEIPIPCSPKWYETAPGILAASIVAFVVVCSTFTWLAYWVSENCHAC